LAVAQIAHRLPRHHSFCFRHDIRTDAGLFTPIAFRSGPPFRQPFRDKYIPEGATVTRDDPQVAAVFIVIASAGVFEVERPLVQQGDETLCGPPAKGSLGVATGFAHFGGIDVGNANNLTTEVNSVSIDNAVLLVGTATQREPRITASRRRTGGNIVLVMAQNRRTVENSRSDEQRNQRPPRRRLPTRLL
jgi:hypothetical protein